MTCVHSIPAYYSFNILSVLSPLLEFRSKEASTRRYLASVSPFIGWASPSSIYPDSLVGIAQIYSSLPDLPIEPHCRKLVQQLLKQRRKHFICALTMAVHRLFLAAALLPLHPNSLSFSLLPPSLANPLILLFFFSYFISLLVLTPPAFSFSFCFPFLSASSFLPLFIFLLFIYFHFPVLTSPPPLPVFFISLLLLSSLSLILLLYSPTSFLIHWSFLPLRIGDLNTRTLPVSKE